MTFHSIQKTHESPGKRQMTHWEGRYTHKQALPTLAVTRLYSRGAWPAKGQPGAAQLQVPRPPPPLSTPISSRPVRLL